MANTERALQLWEEGYQKGLADGRVQRVWQPIENAPRDGENILITDGLYIVVAHWHKDKGWRVAWDHSIFSDSGNDAVEWVPLPDLYNT